MPVRGVNDEFDQLSENLNAMLDRIDSLIEGVKSVADNIAHDLRTPLTRLRGRLENLTARPGLDDDVRDELSSAMSEADHLLATFRALLRIARIESGTHDREWTDVDLRPLLQDAWELYQAVGEEKDIVVHLGAVSGQLRGDRDLLFQARLQPAGQRDQVQPGRVARHARGHGNGRCVHHLRLPTTAPAFRRRNATRCSTASIAPPVWPAFPAADSACRS